MTLSKKLIKIILFLFSFLLLIFVFPERIHAQFVGVNLAAEFTFEKVKEMIDNGQPVSFMANPNDPRIRQILEYNDSKGENHVLIAIRDISNPPEDTNNIIRRAQEWNHTFGSIQAKYPPILIPMNEPQNEFGGTTYDKAQRVIETNYLYWKVTQDSGNFGTNFYLGSPMFNVTHGSFKDLIKEMKDAYANIDDADKPSHILDMFNVYNVNAYAFFNGNFVTDPALSGVGFRQLLTDPNFWDYAKGLTMPVFAPEFGVVDQTDNISYVTYPPELILNFLDTALGVQRDADGNVIGITGGPWSNDPNFWGATILYKIPNENDRPWLYEIGFDQYLRELNEFLQTHEGFVDLTPEQKEQLEQLFEEWKKKIEEGGFEYKVILKEPEISKSLVCKNPNAVEGPFRPEPCDGCGEELMDELLFTPSCAETFEVGQKTWVHVGYEDDPLMFGTGVDGEIEKCAEDTENSSDYFFMRDWGGKLEIDIADTKVPFANYRDKQTEQEAKYLAAYLTGTYGRYGAKCDIDDPECVKQIFRESGVLTKLLPIKIQDKYRCDMIEKVGRGEEYNYKVWNGQSNTPEMTVDNFSLSDFPCQENNLTLEEYKERNDTWMASNKGKNWAFIPMVTYKDAPGTLVIQPQTGTKYPKARAIPSTFPLSIPHLGTLYEASKILHQTLVPNLQESELSAQKNQPVLLASAEIDKQLESDLASSESLCGYQQILGEQTKLLVQANSGPIYRITVENVYLDDNGQIQYGVRIEGLTDQARGNSHIMLGTNGIIPFDLGGGGFPGYYQSNDPSIAAHFGPVQIDANGNFTINVTVNNHTIQIDDSQRVVSQTCTSTVDLATGEITETNCQSAGPPQPPEQPKRCGNQDIINPGTCKDPNAKEDTDNPNDVICSNPFPIQAALGVQNYSNTMSPETFQELKDKVSGCKTACQKDKNSPNCRPPCDWQTFDTTMTRDIGVKLELPYLDQIGHYTISNYYRYTEPKGTFVAANLPKEQSVYGIFDIFRPVEMDHYEPWEAKSNIKYEYTNGFSNAGKVPGHESGIVSNDWEPKRIDKSIYNDPSEGDFYYPWLGGTQWAKKCVSENMLLPKELQKDQYFCPDIQIQQ